MNTMSNTKNDGGPAFPNEGLNGWGKPQEGMTLRDYFAAKAMAVQLGEFWRQSDSPGGYFPKEAFREAIAESSYVIADAMLKAREQ